MNNQGQYEMRTWMRNRVIRKTLGSLCLRLVRSCVNSRRYLSVFQDSCKSEGAYGGQQQKLADWFYFCINFNVYHWFF